ncbi:MAG: class II aldolase/adducin family protein [Polyangiaceae bacterium]
MTSIPSLEGKVSKEEWETRVALAAAYRLTAHYKWDDLVFTHITAKVPGPEKHFLINPYGFLFDEITASSLVKIDLEGNKVIDTPLPVNPAGFLIHSTIHAVRDDAKCVLHTHTLAGVAVSAQKEGLLAISQHSIFPLSSLAYHNYEGVALNDAERPRLVADLGDKMFLILRNHGLLTVGSSVAEAFLAMYFLEASCRIQTMAQAGGSELIPVPAPIVAGAQAMAKQATKGLGADLAWPALLRRLDRLDPSYRT